MFKLNHSVLRTVAVSIPSTATMILAMLSACTDSSPVSASESIASCSSSNAIEQNLSSEAISHSPNSEEPASSAVSAKSTSPAASAKSASSTIQTSSSAHSSSTTLPHSSSISETSSSTAPPSSAEIPPTSSTTSTAKVTLDENGFATVANVYKSLAASEKAVFIIRHSEREDDVAIETELTAKGIQMAQDLGVTLQSDEEFSYITSGFVRTNETANNISKGRGEASLPKLITNYDITGNWFLKISADSLAKFATALGLKGSSVELMAHWAYDGEYTDVLHELTPRAEEFMQSVILKNLPKWKRISIMVSHDILVMPLAVFGSNKKVALKYHEDYHWINYIAGLAVIADAQNNLRYIPVKGTDSGVIDYLALYRKEHSGQNKK